uniref:AP180 N-terminal homology (ANTH) domain-containing protein n=1 Tax=Nelumbo nucifera TaxID=4432 RepID=A0A822ZNC4_NELNU|nr:TPA_asm: hypothetical protein HUJ06_003235 [Nelumbo nucifera]
MYEYLGIIGFIPLRSAWLLFADYVASLQDISNCKCFYTWTSFSYGNIFHLGTYMQPQGAAVYNFVIQLAVSMVASESIKIYHAISDGTVNLVDKFFEMQRHDAVKALDIYRRAGQQVYVLHILIVLTVILQQEHPILINLASRENFHIYCITSLLALLRVYQAERLSEFYEICKSLDLGRGERFIKIEQPPASFITAMEEYVKEAPRVSTVRKDQVVDKIDAPKVVLAIEYKKAPEVQEERPPSPPKPEPGKVEAPVSEPPDLLVFFFNLLSALHST